VNIFVLDKDPSTAATMMCDKHVVKMIVETAQMLCTIAHGMGYEGAPYRSTHKNHPCTVWAAKTSSNWRWLLRHGFALCDEYTKRYGKNHKSRKVIEWCNQLPAIPETGPLTPFAQAMPDQYRNECVVTAYRDYYMGDKSSFATWKTQTPSWWRTQ
jgi:hypothetical protein